MLTVRKIMKIDKSLQSVTSVPANENKKRVDNTHGNSDSLQANNVHFSSNFAKLQTSDIDSNQPAFDVSLVAEVKQAISEGNFHINPEIVADRLLETVKELIQTKKGNI